MASVPNTVFPKALDSRVAAISGGTLPPLLPAGQYGYIPGLDGLRALAVLIVMVAHFELTHLVPGGFGVTVFFFISGFLITRLLLAEHEKKGRIGLRDFYTRRIIRLYPALLFMVLGSSVLFLGLGIGGPSRGELLAATFYVTNAYQLGVTSGAAEPFMSWTHLWSLAVEEHFYLVFPAVLMALGPTKRRTIFVMYAVLLIIPMWRAALAALLSPEMAGTYTYMMTDARMDSLLWGCLLSLLLHHADGREALKRLVGWVPVGAACGLILLTLLFRDESFRMVSRYTLQGVALLVLTLNLYFLRHLRFALDILEWRPLARIGVLSYALYLWHFPIFDVAVRYMDGAILQAGVAFIATYLVAEFSYRCVEAPFVALRKRFGAHIVKPGALKA